VKAAAPAYQTLADGLREQIASGRLRPGDRLPTEPQLCAQSGLSRSTVREALRLLSSQHLIVTTRGVSGGSFVTELSADKVGQTLSANVHLLFANGIVEGAHLFEIRMLMEGPAAELAALRRDDADLAKLEAALTDPLAGAVETRLAAHASFHQALAAATGNPLFELVTHPFYAVANDRQLVEGLEDGYWLEMHADHQAIVGAIRARDAHTAGIASRAHVENLRRVYASKTLTF
jgi:GntR family transcriptional repressor for pyruvate dehydrogenase complex